jgi:general secretion pathway protein G
MRTAGRTLRGFSLIELLVVMAVLGVLAAAVMPLVEVTQQRERERELKRALWDIRDAIDAHKRSADTGQIARVGDGYPASLDVLVQGVPRATGAGKVYFLRRIPVDPFAPAAAAEGAAKAWRLRSYASDPDRPQAGADVYDVHSSSERMGLNGVPLRQW